jgi:DNA-binding NarL/FixJ family response regulator
VTPREQEVLHLVAEGLTNRQIAAQLYLIPKTISSHLVFVFAKLGVSSRSAAARFAREHGLV